MHGEHLDAIVASAKAIRDNPSGQSQTVLAHASLLVMTRRTHPPHHVNRDDGSVWVHVSPELAQATYNYVSACALQWFTHKRYMEGLCPFKIVKLDL